MTDREDAPVVFRLRRIALAVQAGIVVLFLGTSANAVFLVLLDPKSPPAIWGLTAIVIVIMLAYALYVSIYFTQRWLDRPPPIAIGPDGLLDRGLANRPIPWSAMERVQIIRSKGEDNVMFDLRAGHPAVPRLRTLARMMRALNLACGFPACQVMRLGTDATVEKLVTAMTPYVSIARD